jgi:hypothetical protein
MVRGSSIPVVLEINITVFTAPGCEPSVFQIEGPEPGLSMLKSF